MMKRLWLGILVVLLLAACNGARQPTPTWTLAPTQALSASTHTPISPSATFTTASHPVPTITATAMPAITDTAVPTVTPAPQGFGPDNFPMGINPLTGLAVANPALLERRPLGVKVNVVPRGSTRPAWGLSLADIVYDYYHNDGYTRFHAIFYGNDADLVGPIRSGRLPDNDLIRMYKSIFAYGSADARINARFFNAEYSNRLVLEASISPCPPTAEKPMCRYDPSGYDHLLTSTQALSQYITNKGVDNKRPNLNGMTFFPVTPSGGVSGSQVFVRYSMDDYVRWDYDPATGRYLRYQDQVLAPKAENEQFEPLLDRLNNQQIAADNVVVILVPHTYYAPPPGEIVEILLSGSGKAYAFRDGQVYEVAWNRPTVDAVLYLTFPDGSAYPFKPGTTWFQVVSDPTNTTQPVAGAWRFEFYIP